MKDILNRIAERTAANKNEGAFRNRLGVRINDQLHAEFMPLETIIPLAQTFYHPDYPQTHALRENVYAVISKCANTPEIPVDIKATRTDKWYTEEHAAEYPTVVAAQAEIDRKRALEEAAAAEVQRAAVHHNLSRDQLFDITNYLKLTWAEYKKLIEDTRKEPLWWYDSARKRIKKTRPAGTLKTNFLTESLFPADLFTMPEYVPKPDEPKDPRNSDVQLPRTRANDEIWAKYDAELQAHLMYLEDIEAIKRMTAARIRDIQQEFFKEQWAVAMEI